MIDDRVLQRVTDMHAVYRMFGSSGRLLYVGMTADLGKRLGQHAEKRWFPQVATIRLEWFPTEAAARLAEQRAIRMEHPRYNIAGVNRPSPPSRPDVVTTLLAATQLTLAEAVQAGIVGPTIHAVRKARSRDKAFPQPAVRRGSDFIYDVDDLKTWVTNRRDGRKGAV